MSQEFLSYVMDPDMVITDRANHIISRWLTDHLRVAQFACLLLGQQSSPFIQAEVWSGDGCFA